MPSSEKVHSTQTDTGGLEENGGGRAGGGVCKNMASVCTVRSRRTQSMRDEARFGTGFDTSVQRVCGLQDKHSCRTFVAIKEGSMVWQMIWYGMVNRMVNKKCDKKSVDKFRKKPWRITYCRMRRHFVS